MVQTLENLYVKEPLAVYIAGPLNAPTAVDYIKNVHAMLKIANQIRIRGHCCFIPCLDILLGVTVGDMEYDDYFNNSQLWLKRADAMYFMKESPGASRELVTALENGLTVYTTMNEVPWVRKAFDSFAAPSKWIAPLMGEEDVVV